MRKINRAVKIRIYPNKEQITQIEKTIGCSRFLYNRMLTDKIRHYQEEKKMLKNTPAGYKKEYPWLKEVDSLALANVQLNLEGAFRKFFREPGVGFPHYKSKKHSRKSYTTNMVNGNICLQDRFLKLPKMQPVKIKLHRMIPEGWKLKSVTVSREPSGKYFASLLFDCENQTAEKRQAEKFLGMDFAMHGMCVFSTAPSGNPGQLSQWPVQIKLMPTNAPYYDGAHLLIAADCTAYAYGNFHQDFIRGRITLIGCPKLDEGDYTEKLTSILSQNDIKSLTIVRMQVPCCSGLERAAVQALKGSGKFIPWQVRVITPEGQILDY